MILLKVSVIYSFQNKFMVEIICDFNVLFYDAVFRLQRPGFDSRRYQVFWEVLGLERGPLSLESTIEELLERKSSGSGLENREYGRRDPYSDHAAPSIRKKLELLPQAAVARSV
jgi:hypothetical protein